MSNVIKFPLGGRDGPPVRGEFDPTSPNPLDQDTLRSDHIRKTLAYLTPRLFNTLAIAGFTVDTTDENVIVDAALALEAVKSLLYKMNGFHHPLQELAEQMMNEDLRGTKIVDLEILARKKSD